MSWTFLLPFKCATLKSILGEKSRFFQFSDLPVGLIGLIATEVNSVVKKTIPFPRTTATIVKIAKV
jgi:hypothetical protein